MADFLEKDSQAQEILQRGIDLYIKEVQAKAGISEQEVNLILTKKLNGNYEDEDEEEDDDDEECDD